MSPVAPLDDAVSRALLALRAHPSALITDVDGTISPIVVNPSDARVSPAARTALRSLRGQLDTVAVLSGRTVMDARSMVDVAGISYIGNHGMETLRGRTMELDPRVKPFVPIIQSCIECLKQTLGREPVSFENKGCTASAHYRQAGDPAGTRSAILRAIDRCEACTRLKVADGRMVVNFFPPVEVTKGTAIRDLARDRMLRGIVYLGDDVTDLDAFSALAALREEGIQTLAIGVGSPEAPTALLEQADV